MKKGLLSVLVGAMCTLPLLAHAEGTYLGVNFGLAENTLKANGVSGDDANTAYKLYGGYTFNKNFALEGGYVKLAKTSEDDGVDSVRFKPTAIYLAAVGKMPLNEKFELFAKAGITRNSAKVNINAPTFGLVGNAKENHTNAMVGVGLAYSVTNKASVVFEYENFGKVVDYSGIKVKADMFSLGLRYAF